MSEQCKRCPYNHGLMCDQNPRTCPFDEWLKKKSVVSKTERGEK